MMTTLSMLNNSIAKMIYPPIKLERKTYKEYNLYVACFIDKKWGKAQWGMVVGKDMGEQMCTVFLIPKEKEAEVLACLTPKDWIEICQITEKLSLAMNIVAKKIEHEHGN